MVTRQDKANAIRALAMDAVQKANSGHPGMPMGMADIAEVLWSDFLNHNPNNPKWFNRDRFVVSNGHGAMLLYSLLHLSGYDLSIEDLKNFRQLGSKTPGHPEVTHTPGVETTTGPLGQGLANAVGMAIAEEHLAATFNKDGFNIIDHHTYVFAGDGCLMEGISHEACSFAGTHKLNKLIVLWDDNGISIDGKVEGWFTDDTPKRFEAYGWQVIKDVDGHNPESIKKAIEKAKSNSDQPSLICCKTVIGFGSPNKANTAGSHGSPLGTEEIEKTREQLNWHHPAFKIPENIKDAWLKQSTAGQEKEDTWIESFNNYKTKHPELAAEFERRMQGELPNDWTEKSAKNIKELASLDKPTATRKSSLNCLNKFIPLLPELLGGSADLTGSNCTRWDGATMLSANNPDGDYLYYGVREFGMFAMMNGLALHGGVIPFAGTFLTFVDYGRNAVRLAAMMKQRVIFVLSHDSIGLGEDGPTHQPIEHITMLRQTPNLDVWRPADQAETAIAWQQAIEKQSGPSCLLLTRQNVTQNQQTEKQISEISKGAYILLEPNEEPKAIIMATGSEVEIAVNAAKELNQQGQPTRVVSMPCMDRFLEQSTEYQEIILPKTVKTRVAIEAGTTGLWYKLVGANGRVIGIDRFGESAPAKEVYEELGLTKEHVMEAVVEISVSGSYSN